MRRNTFLEKGSGQLLSKFRYIQNFFGVVSGPPIEKLLSAIEWWSEGDGSERGDANITDHLRFESLFSREHVVKTHMSFLLINRFWFQFNKSKLSGDYIWLIVAQTLMALCRSQSMGHQPRHQECLPGSHRLYLLIWLRIRELSSKPFWSSSSINEGRHWRSKSITLWEHHHEGSEIFYTFLR